MLIAAIVGLGILGSGNTAAQATAPTDWYLTVGPSCGSNFLAREPWCGPMLVVRDPQLHIGDELLWPANSLTGPNGPAPLSLGSRAYDVKQWVNYPPVTDFVGPAHYNHTPSGLTAGRYTYKLTVDMSGQWSCSNCNPKGCSWLEGDKSRYEWTFDWDGTNAVTVPPTWHLSVDPSKISGTKACTSIVS